VRAAAATVLALLASAQFLMTLDTSVTNVSIAQVASDLGTTTVGIRKAISLYTLVVAALMLTGGRIGARIGRRSGFSTPSRAPVGHARISKVGENGKHTAVVPCVDGKVELGKDVPHVRLHGLRVEPEPFADATVGQALRQEGEHFALSGGQLL